jgi:hypothetical protein
MRTKLSFSQASVKKGIGLYLSLKIKIAKHAIETLRMLDIATRCGYMKTDFSLEPRLRIELQS